MRVLSIVIWVILGFLYFWFWNSSNADCCGISFNAATTTEISTDNPDGNNLSDAEATALLAVQDKEKAEAKARDSIIAAKAIAEAEENDAVEAVGTIEKGAFYFPYGSNTPNYSQNAEVYLSSVVDAAKASGKKVRVIGHTDDSGTASFNIGLGQRRADEVRRKLIQKGLPANQIIATSKGETEPIASNATPEGQSQNRRVELISE